MKRLWKVGLVLTAGALSAGSLWAESGPYGSPLLPLPESSPALTAPPSGLNRGRLVSVDALEAAPVAEAPAPPPAPPAPEVPADGKGAVQGPSVEDGCAAGCDSGACLDECGCKACARWFGSISGLILSRDNPNKRWLSYETNNNPNQVLNSRDADADWRGGGELRFGRWWCDECGGGRQGLEVSYFTVDNLEGFASVNQADYPDTISSTIDFVNGGILINGNPASDYFDDAEEQRVTRTNEIHNVEINFLCERGLCGSCSRVTWIAGARFLKFDESLIYGSVDAGFNFGDNGGLNEAYLDVDAENNLVGAQIGVQVDYCPLGRWNLFATPKIGIYGNDVSTRSRLYDGAGNVSFDIAGHKTDFAMLAQLDLGLSYQVSCNLRAFGGYRAIAVTGVALADNQIPFYIAAADEFADPDTNGSLILHGAFAGLEWSF